ncbi:MAG: phosphotransferase [Gammaproteobacteria bacterium]|nr:phosphotransferase [Gammaproteobacteria bacterium]
MAARSASVSDSPPTAAARQEAMRRWLQQLGYEPLRLTPASADASFRSYWRLEVEGEPSRIVMDAPPEKEPLQPFVAIAKSWRGIGLNLPQVLAEERGQGFLLLSDLGCCHYLQQLRRGEEGYEPVQLYRAAIEALVLLQQQQAPQTPPLPAYDRQLLLSEMELFTTYFLAQQLQLELTATEEDLLNQTFALLTENALEQPQVAVHRDYHSRNLMVTEPLPGVLDFQDAVIGPLSYDLVSLLRDCYIAWPEEWVTARIEEYLALATEAGVVPSDCSRQQFRRWFDRMGLQRHLKAIGIFSRLNIRDGKPGYLGDIPRTFGYLVAVSGSDAALQPFHTFLLQRVAPLLDKQQLQPQEGRG